MANPNIPPGPGRPKGSKDKIPQCIKARVMAVWDELKENGQDLADCAKSDPPWFYQNFVKPMLPKDVVLQGDKDSPLIMKIERVIVENLEDKDS
jgi:hypothetical protein